MDKILRLAIEPDPGEVCRVTFVETDQAGNVTETYPIPYGIEQGKISPLQAKPVNLPPPTLEPLNAEEEEKRSEKTGTRREMSANLDRSEVFWGKRLGLAREFRGLTQTELGEKIAASCALISLCETGKKRDPASDLIEACGSVLGFAPAFFYGPLDDVFQEHECSFRHRRTAPERLKAQIRAHATLIGLVIEKLPLRIQVSRDRSPTNTRIDQRRDRGGG